MARSSMSAELPLQINKDSTVSLPSQIAEQVRTHILNRTLAPGDALPATRVLADRLGISRGSVVAAYEQLTGEGYVSSDTGGTKVSADLAQIDSRVEGGEPIRPPQPSPHTRPIPQRMPTRENIDLRPGTPDTSALATSAWRAAWRSAVGDPGHMYPAAGSPALQAQLSEHLRLMRSVVREPETIMVTAGARDAFRLVLSALRRQIHDRPLRIAVENPGYPSLHKIPATFGHEIMPIPVDEHGLNPAFLPCENGPDVVLVAPSHQYPLGASMPVGRRLELLNWAADNNVFIVEDDYDSELRYGGDPLPALAALARSGADESIEQGAEANRLDRVMTLGSFAKTVSPGLGLGFLVAPASLKSALWDLREDLGSPVSAVVQDAMTNFMAEGGVRRHIARMRRVYLGRRNLLLFTLESEEIPAWVRILPMDGGLHVALEFSGEYATAQTERRVLEIAETSGVLVGALGDYWAHTDETDTERSFGLVVGFGGVNDRVLRRGLHLLAVALKQVQTEHAEYEKPE